MAGNVWEFVLAADARNDSCVLRGGSYKNVATEIRSYLRLSAVPKWLRVDDFGFRLAQLDLSAAPPGPLTTKSA